LGRRDKRRCRIFGVGVLTRRTALGALLSPLFLTGCGLGSGESYRYRMTVVVDTPEGPRSGSSVIEVRAHPTGPLAASVFNRRSYGEAPFVDLPGRRTLFALLSNKPDGYNAGDEYPQFAYADAVPRGLGWREQARALKRQTSSAMLPPEHYPQLVTFRDPKDVTSIEIVDPADLAASFGAGIALRNIEIAITSDPVTKRLSGRLPNFGPSSGYDQWARQLHVGDPRLVTLDDFQRNS
jgi:hypothetical protein